MMSEKITDEFFFYFNNSNTNSSFIIGNNLYQNADFVDHGVNMGD